MALLRGVKRSNFEYRNRSFNYHERRYIHQTYKKN